MKNLSIALLFLTILGVAKCAGPQIISINEYTPIGHTADGFDVGLSIETTLEQVSNGFVEQWEQQRPSRLFVSSAADDLDMISATIIWLKATGLTSGVTFRSDVQTPQRSLTNYSNLDNSFFSQGFDLEGFGVEPIAVELDIAVCFINGRCNTVTVGGTLNFTTNKSLEFSWVNALMSI
ncbi:MAG: hypothetical protein GQ535_05755 [Rhodobacteraceae bacterium]|nr:hypothetical protein [Paracoccaceae bacterium]